MKVLHIDSELSWRGGENQIHLLVKGLNDQGIENHLMAQPGSAILDRLQGGCRVFSRTMRGGLDLGAARDLARYIREHSIDVIDAHTSKAHSIALLSTLFSHGARVVVHRRVDYRPKTGWLGRLKYLSPRVDCFVAISRGIARVLAASGVSSKTTAVVPSAVDPAPYDDLDRKRSRKQWAQRLGLAEDVVWIGNASAMTEQKGYPTLIRALGKLAKSGEADFHCLIAGDGHLRPEIERLVGSLGLEKHVTFLGWIDTVPDFLSSLDILAMPSDFEGLGTLILEGIYAGCAVAATGVGGIPEMIVHEETGLLSPVREPDALALNLRRLVLDPDLRSRLNAAARAKIAEEFSLSAMVRGNLAVYRDVLTKPYGCGGGDRLIPEDG